MDLKLSESMQGCLEDVLEAECLVGDIYTSKHKIEEKKKKQVQKQNTNLISVKLVQNISTKT